MTTAELAEALKPVIREVVRETMQSELREILTEAVEIASRPGAEDTFEIEESKPVVKRHFETPDWVKELDTKSKQSIAEGKSTQNDPDAQHGAIMNILGQTARSMTSADLSNFG